jgi:hypothetical protein
MIFLSLADAEIQEARHKINLALNESFGKGKQSEKDLQPEIKSKADQGSHAEHKVVLLQDRAFQQDPSQAQSGQQTGSENFYQVPPETAVSEFLRILSAALNVNGNDAQKQGEASSADLDQFLKLLADNPELQQMFYQLIASQQQVDSGLLTSTLASTAAALRTNFLKESGQQIFDFPASLSQQPLAEPPLPMAHHQVWPPGPLLASVPLFQPPQAMGGNNKEAEKYLASLKDIQSPRIYYNPYFVLGRQGMPPQPQYLPLVQMNGQSHVLNSPADLLAAGLSGSENAAIGNSMRAATALQVTRIVDS